MEDHSTSPVAADEVLDLVRAAAFVFYVEGRWRPFDTASPESRVTRPADATHVQFNSLPGRAPHAEYRGPLGRWWVRIDPDTGMPLGGPVYVPTVDASSSAVN